MAKLPRYLFPSDYMAEMPVSVSMMMADTSR